MKRIILSLVAICSMFFLAESAKAQPLSMDCTDYTSQDNYIQFSLENGCIGYVHYCCKFMEIGYEMQVVINRIEFLNIRDCSGAELIDQAKYWSAVHEAIAEIGCGGQKLIVLPCEEGVKPTSVSLSIIRSACTRIIYDESSQKLSYSFKSCEDMDGGYCYNKYTVCWDKASKKAIPFLVSSEFVEGDCNIWNRTIKEIVDLFQNYDSGICYSLPCSQ